MLAINAKAFSFSSRKLPLTVALHDLAKFGESGKRDSHRRLKCGMILTAESYSRTTMLPFVGIPPTIQA
ncbi:MAG: hypothetical protein AAGA75_13865, partial [Cyanobacteria bacterium P01_E01_bin.6]